MKINDIYWRPNDAGGWDLVQIYLSKAHKQLRCKLAFRGTFLPLVEGMVGPLTPGMLTAQPLTDIERTALTGLVEATRTAFLLLDESEIKPDNVLVTPEGGVTAFEAALDTLEALPDDRPGYTLGPSGKAEWALRRLYG